MRSASPSMGRATAEGREEALGQVTYSCRLLLQDAESGRSHKET
jgi:hypothetical protein